MKKMNENVLIRKIYFLTGKKYLDLTLSIKKMDEKGKQALLKVFQDIEYEIQKIKKSQFNLKKFII